MFVNNSELQKLKRRNEVKQTFNMTDSPNFQDLVSVDLQSLKVSARLFFFDFYCYPYQEWRSQGSGPWTFVWNSFRANSATFCVKASLCSSKELENNMKIN